MRNFNTKIDNDNTSAGVVVADEYNSIFNENKNVITPFMGLNEADSQQMIKSIDIVSKAMFYTDVGTVNAIELERGATTSTIETLFDGMVVMFTPANANTGATTLKVKTLTAKALKYNGADLTSGFLSTGLKYIAVYDGANGWFDCDIITTGLTANEYIKYKDGTLKTLAGANLMANSLGVTAGYQKLPNGIIMQWGQDAITTAGTTVTFPITFPNTVLSILATDRGTPDTISVSSWTNSNMVLDCTANTTPFWFVLGY